jgi:hypothetical protein
MALSLRPLPWPEWCCAGAEKRPRATNPSATVLTLGDGGTTRNVEKLYLGLQVTRPIQSDWVSEADIGILARNLDSSPLDLRLASGFTIGLRIPRAACC